MAAVLLPSHYWVCADLPCHCVVYCMFSSWQEGSVAHRVCIKNNRLTFGHSGAWHICTDTSSPGHLLFLQPLGKKFQSLRNRTDCLKNCFHRNTEFKACCYKKKQHLTLFNTDTCDFAPTCTMYFILLFIIMIVPCYWFYICIFTSTI